MSRPRDLIIHNVVTPTSREPQVLIINASKPTAIASLNPASAGLPNILDTTFTHFVDGGGGLLLPALCHPGIHLDKAFLLGSSLHGPILSSSFADAMELSEAAKAAYTLDDLMARGRRLISESVAAGVTAMRVYTEVDQNIGSLCLEAALALKAEFGPELEGRGVCDIQIAVFMQNPAQGPSEAYSRAIRKKFADALKFPGVACVAVSPYVESTLEKAALSVDWAIDIAILHRKHLDIHLSPPFPDISDPSPHVQNLLSSLHTRHWKRLMPLESGFRITLSGVTSQLPPGLLAEVATAGLGIHIVGRSVEDIPVAAWNRELGLNCALGVGAVGCALRPWGGVDPMELVGARTVEERRALLECVSWRAREAIGLGRDGGDKGLEEGGGTDLVVVGKGGGGVEAGGGWGKERIVVKQGRVVARGWVEGWVEDFRVGRRCR